MDHPPGHKKGRCKELAVVDRGVAVSGSSTVVLHLRLFMSNLFYMGDKNALRT